MAMRSWAADGFPGPTTEGDMTVTVNGETIAYTGDATLAALVACMGAEPDRVATMLNDEVVRKPERDTTALNDGDRVEILSFAGGG